MVEFISVILAGSVFSMILPDGKLSKPLGLILSSSVILLLLGLFSSVNISLPEFSDYEPEKTDGTKNIIRKLAEEDAEKILAEYSENAEAEASVVSVGDSYFVEKITVFSDIPPDSNAVEKLCEHFGLPTYGVEVINEEGEE